MDDRLVEKLTPEYFKHWREADNRHSGPKARMILKVFHSELLVIVKSIKKGDSIAEMVASLNKSSL